jgi:hypothetical protein
MSAKPQPEPSHSSVSRATGVVSRWFGGASSIQAFGWFLRRQLWAWPLLAAVLFGGTGWWVHHSVENTMREQRAAELNAMVDASANAVRVWMGEQRINVQLIAADEQLRQPVTELLRLSDGTPTAERQLIQAKAQEALRARLQPRLQVTGYVGYHVVSPDGVVLAADQDAPIGKPANIILTRRGGIHDFVKVLDFGLARAIDGHERLSVTSPNTLVGTPLYFAPETVNQPDQVDACTDVYALGAVAYFLLTGTPVFLGTSVMEICMHHVRTAPEPPSKRCGKPISPGLEALLLRCLAKAPADRPRDAAELLRELESCTVAGTWTAQDAAAWWAAPNNLASPTVEVVPGGHQLAATKDTNDPDGTGAYPGPERDH